MGFEDSGVRAPGLIEYPNVPPLIGYAISAGKASFEALATVLSVEDLWDILEIAQVDAYNRRILERAREREQRNH